MKNNDKKIYWEYIFQNSSDSIIKAFEQANLDAMRKVANITCSNISYINYEKEIELITKTLTDQYIQDFKQIASPKILADIAHLQTSIALDSLLYNSEMITKIAKNIASLNLTGCIAAVQDTVNQPSIIMSDYSFIKTSTLIKDLQSAISFPYGFVTDIKNVNISSAKQIVDSKSIVYKNNKRVFVTKNGEATPQELNTICSAVRLFKIVNDNEHFTEEELIDFMSFIEKTPKIAIKHPVGEKIYQIIQEINNSIDFDKEYYFHSRPREKSVIPYSWELMLKAPYGVSSIGRFNDVGQPRFYFTDTLEGSINEIRKHMDKDDNYVIQTVKISVRNHVKLLDFSAKEMRGLNNFLRFIRFPNTKDSGKRPREYLIPQFVADCCSSSGFDGIKYYGGKNYSNYVTWQDNHFDYVTNVGDSSI